MASQTVLQREHLSGSFAVEENRSRTDFLVTLFESLDDNAIRYCVLHSWEGLPAELTSDLDIAVHPEDAHKLPKVFHSLQGRGYLPVQSLNYSVRANYFVFFWRDKKETSSVALDIILEHRRGGLLISSGEALVSGRRKHGIFWIPSPESEFLYLLAKKSCKGSASARQASRLKHLVEQIGSQTAEHLSGRLFLGKAKVRAVRACANGQLNQVLGAIKGQTWKTSLMRNPVAFAGYIFSDAGRRISRWLKPTGYWIAIMGPDGAGKSTIIANTVETVGPAFRRHTLFHWRPGFLYGRKDHTVTDRPHGEELRGNWSSILKLLVYVLDYWLGYWLLIRPMLAKSGLVVFDRYFDDLLIDARRYRYGGPQWVVRIFRRLIPKPGLLLVLDAPEHVILARKQELAPSELHRQRQSYAEYQASIPGSRLVDASPDIQQVSAEVAGIILERLAERFRRQHSSCLS